MILRWGLGLGKFSNGLNDTVLKRNQLHFSNPFPVLLKLAAQYLRTPSQRNPLARFKYIFKWIPRIISVSRWFHKKTWQLGWVGLGLTCSLWFAWNCNQSLSWLELFWYVWNVFDMSIMICLKLWSKIFVAQTICSDRPPPNFAVQSLHSFHPALGFLLELVQCVILRWNWGFSIKDYFPPCTFQFFFLFLKIKRKK